MKLDTQAISEEFKIFLEQGEDESRETYLMRLHNGAQLMLIRFQLESGIIKDSKEYIDKTAEIFRMMAMGVIHANDRELHGRDLRQELLKVTIEPER